MMGFRTQRPVLCLHMATIVCRLKKNSEAFSSHCEVKIAKRGKRLPLTDNTAQCHRNDRIHSPLRCRQGRPNRHHTNCTQHNSFTHTHRCMIHRRPVTSTRHGLWRAAQRAARRLGGSGAVHTIITKDSKLNRKRFEGKPPFG